MERRHEISEESFNARQFRDVLGRFASGVTVVTTAHEGHVHGMTANAFVSVSLNPPLVLVSVNNRAHMHKALLSSSRYAVSILAEGQEALSDHFAGRTAAGLEVSFIYKDGLPVLKDAAAYLVCRVHEIHPAGDHTLYIGEVEFLELSDGRPLVFYAGKYRYLDVERLKQPQWPEDDFSLFSITNF